MCSNNCSLDGSLVGFANQCMHVQVQRCSRKVFERLVQSVLLCQLRCSVLIQWQAALVTVQLQCGFMSDALSHTGDTHVKQSKDSSAHEYAFCPSTMHFCYCRGNLRWGFPRRLLSSIWVHLGRHCHHMQHLIGGARNSQPSAESRFESTQPR